MRNVRDFFATIRSKLIRIVLGRELFLKLTEPQNNSVLDAQIRTTPRATLTSVAISLVEHCNLKCWGCDHCAPLAEPEFLTPLEFERDMERLAQLTGGIIGVIKLLGGEPLLHDEIGVFTEITRRFFPESRIEIVTNALLLAKKQDSFWDNCHKNTVSIVATKYPLNINWEKIKSKAQEKNVEFCFYGDSGTVQKSSSHIPFDTSGVQDTAANFMRCFHANNCRELHHGRLYTCTVAPHARHFNKSFNKNLRESAEDSIDIYNAVSIKEIMEFLARPIPFCRYCNVSARSFDHPWRRSEKNICEWTLLPPINSCDKEAIPAQNPACF
jgi:MoaA/NifB/PqqE/SkfB family radical SAM enzyme